MLSNHSQRLLFVYNDCLCNNFKSKAAVVVGSSLTQQKCLSSNLDTPFFSYSF
ncbi:hypothetical protein HanRHA438_Chr09g0423921 [Helianthus annuus]|nr:hypothetical protein HanRHA438_Chr09g0423921 [Helianthus annuus]